MPDEASPDFQSVRPGVPSSPEDLARAMEDAIARETARQVGDTTSVLTGLSEPTPAVESDLMQTLLGVAGLASRELGDVGLFSSGDLVSTPGEVPTMPGDFAPTTTPFPVLTELAGIIRPLWRRATAVCDRSAQPGSTPRLRDGLLAAFALAVPTPCRVAARVK
jgi:hypothetical protein